MVAKEIPGCWKETPFAVAPSRKAFSHELSDFGHGKHYWRDSCCCCQNRKRRKFVTGGVLVSYKLAWVWDLILQRRPLKPLTLLRMYKEEHWNVKLG